MSTSPPPEAITPDARAATAAGRLIVVEGPDCSGRSTQVRLLEEWLARQGMGVLTTTLGQGALTGQALEKAKRRPTMSRRTRTLLYAADMAERVEHEIRPALEAGLMVLCDRYFHTLLARHALRGLDPAWLRDVFSFAPAPDLALYLQTRLDDLSARALNAGRMGYWECGLDLNLAPDRHTSFLKYQRRMLRQFRDIVTEYGLIRVAGSGDVHQVQRRIQGHVANLLPRPGKPAMDHGAVNRRKP